MASPISSALFFGRSSFSRTCGIEAEDARGFADQRGDIPLFGVELRAGKPVDLILEDVFGQRQHVGVGVDDLVFGEVDLALENLAAQRVDALTLLVHHVVVFEQVLADGEVLRLDLLLRPLDGAA